MPNIRVTAKTYHVKHRFDRGVGGLGPAIASKERHYRKLLQTRIRYHASGRPGPERISGDYLDSIEIRASWVGTDDPRGRRLEFGYHGPDADGVTYDQPPYPHFFPAVEEVRPLFFASMEWVVTEALGP